MFQKEIYVYYLPKYICKLALLQISCLLLDSGTTNGIVVTIQSIAFQLYLVTRF